MVEIGSHPLLWHIMKYYSSFGVHEFIICLGYRGYMIKEYFANYFLHSSDVTVDLSSNSVIYHDTRSEPWKVTLVDTGEATATAGRVLRVGHHLEAAEPFFLTYGDGLADVDLDAQLAFHREHGCLATMTVVRPPARFGSAVVEDGRVVDFKEKPQASEGLINGGFFILSRDALNTVQGDDTPLESDALARFAEMDQLRAWKHEGFWQSMDTLREKEVLESLWLGGHAPWKVWA